MAIEFPCATCGQQVRTPDAAAGKKGKCPSCGHVQRIPGGATPASVPPSAAPATQPTPLPPKPPAQPAPPPVVTPPVAPAPTPAPTHLKPAAAKLIKPDPPSLTPSQPPSTLSPTKLPEPKLPTPLATPGKTASQWTSYVKRGAESVRPTPMPPADPRIAPRPPAEKQVLPRLEPIAPSSGDAASTTPAPRSQEQRAAADNQQRRQLLDQLTRPATQPPAETAPETASETTSGRETATATASAHAPPAAADKFEFPCPSCGKANRASAATAGKKGRCPHCQTLVQIPSLPAASPAASKRATEGTSAKLNPIAPGKKWETGSAGPVGEATAVEVPSLTPIPAEEPVLPELAPLSPEQIARLLALESAAATPALTPLGPAASLPTLTPYAADAGGYLPPAKAAGYSGTRSRQAHWNPPTSHHRRGLPWERDASLGPLMETAAAVVFSPVAAFRDMWQSGGIGYAIGYAALVSFAVAVITAVFSVLFQSAVGGLSWLNVRPPGGPPFDNPAFRNNVTPAILHLLGREVGTNLAIATFQLTVSAVISSGLTHALLALFGGARGGFGTTFRVFLYCMASTAFFQFIPCCGIWVATLWTFIILMIGVTYAHDTNGLAGAGAVFLGVGVYYALLFWILSIFFLGIFYAAAGPELFR